MKCKWTDCENEVTGKALYCSGACRVKQSRSVTESPASVTSSPASVTLATVTGPPSFELLIDETVYGRRAVRYPGDTFDTRPEPLDHDDIPDPRNRCMYQRQDGTRYLLDATGNQHDRPEQRQVRDLTDADLQLRMNSYYGNDWVNSPEHKEVLRRRVA